VAKGKTCANGKGHLASSGKGLNCGCPCSNCASIADVSVEINGVSLCSCTEILDDVGDSHWVKFLSNPGGIYDGFTNVGGTDCGLTKTTLVIVAVYSDSGCTILETVAPAVITVQHSTVAGKWLGNITANNIAVAGHTIVSVGIGFGFSDSASDLCDNNLTLNANSTSSGDCGLDNEVIAYGGTMGLMFTYGP
jgi:hypothetical protein